MLSEHPASPVLLTRYGPLGTRINPRVQLSNPKFVHLKFENRSRTNASQMPLIICFTSQDSDKVPAILRETSEETSY